MKYKEGVVWTNMCPEIEDAAKIVERVYQDFNTELIITSGRDGQHKTGSRHYEGKAFDVRTWNMIARLVEVLKQKLGKEYDVVLEADHIHVEYDPK